MNPNTLNLLQIFVYGLFGLLVAVKIQERAQARHLRVLAWVAVIVASLFAAITMISFVALGMALWPDWLW